MYKGNQNIRLRRRAFTLVEVVISTLLVGVLLIGSLTLLSHKARADRFTGTNQDGHALAQQLMSEILQSPYKDPDQTPTFGRESGESGSDRATWDDLDDYNLLSDAPPKRKDGTAIAGYTGWTRTVSVQYADTASLAAAGTSSDTGLKRVTVTVTSPTGAITTMTALRSNIGNFDHQKMYSRQFTSHIGAQLQVGSDATTSILSGTATFNEPPQNLSNLLYNGDIEDDLDNWLSYNCNLSTDSSPHSGTTCLKAKERATVDATAYQDVTAIVQNGKSYYVEAWVRTNSGTNMVSLSLKTTDSVVGAAYTITPSFTVGPQWTRITGVLSASWPNTLSEARLRLFTYPDGHTGDLYIDDVVMAELP